MLYYKKILGGIYMSYSSYLASIIKSSGYSLRNIATLCEKNHNVKITASYLSKLQKESNKNPASEKVNTAIAKVCKTNPDDLNFEADFERAPETVKQTINELIEFLKNFLIQTSKTISVPDKEKELKIESEINKYLNMSSREFLQLIMQYSELQTNKIPFEESFDLNKDNIEDIIMKFSIDIPMKDNSMFPTIKQGAKLEIVKLDSYSNGDIVSVNINEETNIIRTYIEAGNNIILLPENKEFEIITIEKENAIINGKVKSITVDL